MIMVKVKVKGKGEVKGCLYMAAWQRGWRSRQGVHWLDGPVTWNWNGIGIGTGIGNGNGTIIWIYRWHALESPVSPSCAEPCKYTAVAMNGRVARSGRERKRKRGREWESQRDWAGGEWRTAKVRNSFSVFKVRNRFLKSQKQFVLALSESHKMEFGIPA